MRVTQPNFEPQNTTLVCKAGGRVVARIPSSSATAEQTITKLAKLAKR